MQYTKKMINREILKAFAGFKNTHSKVVVSGNWGCGVFKGDYKLKLIIQWIAASMANKTLKHCPYGKNMQLNENFKELQNIEFLNLGEPYKTLMTVSDKWERLGRRGEKKIFMDEFYGEMLKKTEKRRNFSGLSLMRNEEKRISQKDME